MIIAQYLKKIQFVFSKEENTVISDRKSRKMPALRTFFIHNFVLECIL